MLVEAISSSLDRVLMPLVHALAPGGAPYNVTHMKTKLRTEASLKENTRPSQFPYQSGESISSCPVKGNVIKQCYPVWRQCPRALRNSLDRTPACNQRSLTHYMTAVHCIGLESYASAKRVCCLAALKPATSEGERHASVPQARQHSCYHTPPYMHTIYYRGHAEARLIGRM